MLLLKIPKCRLVFINKRFSMIQTIEQFKIENEITNNFCISHSANTLGKGMNPTILPPTMGK